jgi:hypothetical protein
LCASLTDGKTNGLERKLPSDRRMCFTASVSGTLCVLPCLAMGKVRIPLSKSTQSHRKPNCSDCRSPVSTLNWTSAHPSGDITPRSRRNSSSLRNRTRCSSAKNGKRESGLLTSFLSVTARENARLKKAKCLFTVASDHCRCGCFVCRVTVIVSRMRD